MLSSTDRWIAASFSFGAILYDYESVVVALIGLRVTILRLER